MLATELNLGYQQLAALPVTDVPNLRFRPALAI
jgi:hypothetical protein